VLFANLLIFPAKQIITYLFSHPFIAYENRNLFLIISIFIETIPIILKYSINLKIYSEFNRISYFEDKVDSQTIFSFSLTANIISAALGLMMLYVYASAVLHFA
jgi:hypothetical protein